MSERQILITIDMPTGWDEEDFDYVTERLGYALARDLPSCGYEIKEIEG